MERLAYPITSLGIDKLDFFLDNSPPWSLEAQGRWPGAGPTAPKSIGTNTSFVPPVSLSRPSQSHLRALFDAHKPGPQPLQDDGFSGLRLEWGSNLHSPYLRLNSIPKESLVSPSVRLNQPHLGESDEGKLEAARALCAVGLGNDLESCRNQHVRKFAAGASRYIESPSLEKQMMHRLRRQDSSIPFSVPACECASDESLAPQDHVRVRSQENIFKCHWPGCDTGQGCKHHEQPDWYMSSCPVIYDPVKRQFTGLNELNRHRNLNSTPTELSAISERHSSRITALAERLAAIFRDVVQYKQLLSCRDKQAQKLLDLFQWLLDTPGLDSGFRRNLIVATQRLSKHANLYPDCYSLKNVETIGDHPVAAGSFADIYKGSFQGQLVCMKVIRIYEAFQVDYFLQHCSKEAILWGQLTHRNVLPIYGLYRFQSRVCLVSPWMENGDISRYLSRNPSVDRVRLAFDVAEGLMYLHTNGIIHGDLKGANILVADSGRACLADFGLSSVSDANILNWTSHSSAASRGGSIRWQAPELFDVNNDEVVHNSEASDVYAWACVCYEIFTGDIPFVQLARDCAVMLQVKAGRRPPRPAASGPSWHWGLTEELWLVMQECWREDPSERPIVSEIIRRLSLQLLKDRRPENGDFLSPARFRSQSGSVQGGNASVYYLERILDVAVSTGLT